MAAEERTPWDRMPNESTKAYDAFREFRDLGPRRRIEDGRSKHFASKYAWMARATAWDDEIARRADDDRLEALRAMHSHHAEAARAVREFAVAALAKLDADAVSATDVARLLELGAKLERLTLTQSVEELQGRTPHSESDDPWDRIARELADASHRA